ncbi:UvrD-helicase domain-containing protein [Actinopolyspora sp. H202]|uniref:UvrD-helicase domain-containing protein n=1 Tax=Actinopolyspora sp. H202 TaxID=1500456 RepID=UPI003EE50AC0
MSTRVVISDLFENSYKDLENSIKNKVLDFIVKLQTNPDLPGLNIKTPQGVTNKRIKTGKVSDFWRAVLIELPESCGYVMVAVKPHDDAYTYAGKLRFGVNEVTGALEVVNEAALNEAISHASSSGSHQARPTPILRHVKAGELREFGIDEEIAAQLVAITDENELLNIAEELPGIQGKAVIDLAAGRTPEDAWKDLVIERENEIDTEDVLTALERPLSRVDFTDGRDIDELRAILEDDFKAWRVWLHPLQRKLAYHDGWRGPYRVTGGAGTGKTVTAIHRARHLAQRLESEGSESRILFTTFTKNLARDIKSQLVELAGSDILNRVKVLHIDALAQRVLATGEDNGAKPRMFGEHEEEIKQAWRQARDQAEENWDIDFLRSEWSEVVLAQGLTERSEYLKASRSGRGKRISRPQRAELWAIFEKFTQTLNAQNLTTFTQASARAAAIAAQLSEGEPGNSRRSAESTLSHYRHAIIDEAQDLHPVHWSLIRSLISKGNDDLFIVGDAHQRIYGRQVVLSRMGIETRGRSRRLTVNYRTSKQILNWSIQVAYGPTVDDLDGDEESLTGARSEFVGPEPVPRGYDNWAEEKTGLIRQLRSWYESGIPWSEMAVIAREHMQTGNIGAALEEAAVPMAKIAAHTDESKLGNQVRVMTMHRAKGLEFRAVAVVGLSEKDFPPSFIREVAEDELPAAWARERNLLYVSGSRAREELYVSWHGKRSELVPEN